jgi:hypothetical protein
MKTLFATLSPISIVALCLPWYSTLMVILGVILTLFYIYKLKEKVNAFTRKKAIRNQR